MGENTRKPAKRSGPFRVVVPFSSRDEFAQGFREQLNEDGFFVTCENPPKQGARIKFELVLQDKRTKALRGDGVVQWTRPDGKRNGRDSFGVAIEFAKLDKRNREVVNGILQAPNVGGSNDSVEEKEESTPEQAAPEPTPDTKSDAGRERADEVPEKEEGLDALLGVSGGELDSIMSRARRIAAREIEAGLGSAALNALLGKATVVAATPAETTSPPLENEDPVYSAEPDEAETQLHDTLNLEPSNPEEDELEGFEGAYTAVSIEAGDAVETASSVMEQRPADVIDEAESEHTVVGPTRVPLHELVAAEDVDQSPDYHYMEVEEVQEIEVSDDDVVEDASLGSEPDTDEVVISEAFPPVQEQRTITDVLNTLEPSGKKAAVHSVTTDEVLAEVPVAGKDSHHPLPSTINASDEVAAALDDALFFDDENTFVAEPGAPVAEEFPDVSGGREGGTLEEAEFEGEDEDKKGFFKRLFKKE